ncbi:putative SOS response-associated peptidase YedK [Halorubrum trapanicum]|uniref:Putative SOS response-associated peptidase YedK n=1 Tax=Halorubrum trapanicum TaxID=29284 RepID=A0A8J7UPT5_9EURY|nr:SOS response-associated peptidase [Halorubrum trapanicum]MBP1901793.1 putative SOS response-associated peptidase YedK [Halorubrum trapanicum]
MCGRYTLFTPTADLEDRFDADFGDREPSYNCAPGQSLPVITDEAPEEAIRMEWGLTPSWADESFDLINARAETVREKRSFADAFERRRCLVPADGFYEWVGGGGPDGNRDGSGKTPYRVAFEDDRPFAMAGIYERWEPPTPETSQTGLGAFGGGDGGGGSDGTADDSGAVETFAVLTTEPNDLVADLHHRMAVILDPDAGEEEAWLRGDSEEAAALLDPYPSDGLTAHPVSTRVNSPGVDAPELIDPVAGD